MLFEKQQLAQALQLRYHCSEACATSTVNSYYPDEEKCRATISGKMTAPFVLIVGMVPKQHEYIESLSRDLATAFQNFPYLNGTAKPQDEEQQDGYINAVASGKSGKNGTTSPLAPIDWAEVRARLFSHEKAPLWYMYTELVFSGDTHDLRIYENAYQNLIVKEGFSHVLGCYASGDGMVPALDYVNARLCGEPVQSLARRMNFGEDIVEALESVEAEVPTCVYTRVNVFGNNPATSCSSRQDKGHAQQVLKEAGLPYIRYCVTTRVDEAVAKVKDGTLLLPVVVKPNSGAGSEFVALCYTVEDIRVAFSMVEGVRTSQGTDAAQLVVEEYIEGPEYVVNTVSYQGVHVVTDVWESWKYPEPVVTTGLTRSAEEALRAAGIERQKQHKTSILYDRQTLIPNLADLPASHSARRIVEYTLKCLDALGLENGCGHSELRLDTRKMTREWRQQDRQRLRRKSPLGAANDESPSEGQPLLIELNSRMQGDIPRSNEVIGYDQYSLLVYISEAVNVFGAATAVSTAWPFRVDSSSRPPRVGEIPWPPVPRLYRARHSAGSPMTTTVLFLATKEECILNGVALQSLTELRTFQRFTRTIFKPNQPGFVTPLRRTIDLFSSPTSCVMQGSTADVEADCATIRSMESATLSSSTRAALFKLASSIHETERLRESIRTLDERLGAVTVAYRDAAALAGLSAGRTTEDGKVNDKYKSKGNGDHSCQSELVALQCRLSALQSELTCAKNNVSVYERRVQHQRTDFANALASQQPAPLYISYQDFSIMKATGVGNKLAVT
ncbi:Phosphoribosylglycinamide synthetase, ATP-grasp (A) domain/ATP-grasp domain containing protein, putative [Leishmania guyanensis]